VAVLFCALPGSAAAAAAPSLVVFRPQVANAPAQTRARERDLDFHARHVFSHALRGFSAPLNDQQVAALRADPEVAFVEPDRRVTALGAPVAAGELTPTGLLRAGAVSGGVARNPSGAAVAVIDTGVDLANPDLNAVAGTNCINPGAPPQDDHGHGTHVAGTIAGRNDGSGVVGVAPGTRIVAVKVLDSSGQGRESDVICGIDWVTAHAAEFGIRVANMSLGGGGVVGTCDSGAEHHAICASVAAGVSYVVAAGNSGVDFAGRAGQIPAAFPEVLTVTAMADSDGVPGGTGPSPACVASEQDDARATFSDYASGTNVNHTIAAPGVCVVSDRLGGGTATMSGTSMASPHVAGAMALCYDDGGTPGPCAGQAPAQAMTTLRTAAQAAATPGNGFNGDPFRPLGAYYGYLLNATPAPRVATLGAENVADHEATVHGTVDSGGAAGNWHVEYGPTTDYGHVTPEQPDTDDPTTVLAAQLTGMQAGTAQHYRFVATGTGWTSTGADMTFQTTGTPPPPPPDTRLDSAPPDPVAQTQATFEFSAAGGTTPTGFQCRLDLGAWIACTSPASYAGLAERRHRFDVRAVGPDDAVDPTPATRSWLVDVTPPDTLISGGPSGATDSAAASFQLSASEPGSAFSCRIDGGPWQPCTQSPSYDQLAPGSHVFDGIATDPAGNSDPTPATRTWSVSFPPAPVPPMLVPETSDASNPLAPVAPPISVAQAPAAPPLLVLKGRPRISGGRLRVRISCRGAGTCRATLELRADRRLLGRRSLSVAGDTATTVSLELTTRAQKLLRSRRGVRADLYVAQAGSRRHLGHIALA
jgi:subtilisin